MCFEDRGTEPAFLWTNDGGSTKITRSGREFYERCKEVIVICWDVLIWVFA